MLSISPFDVSLNTYQFMTIDKVKKKIKKRKKQEER